MRDRQGLHAAGGGPWVINIHGQTICFLLKDLVVVRLEHQFAAGRIRPPVPFQRYIRRATAHVDLVRHCNGCIRCAKVRRGNSRRAAHDETFDCRTTPMMPPMLIGHEAPLSRQARVGQESAEAKMNKYQPTCTIAARPATPTSEPAQGRMGGHRYTSSVSTGGAPPCTRRLIPGPQSDTCSTRQIS